MKGKITLPTTHNGKKITAVFRGKTTENAAEVDNGFCYNKDITHVFWADKGVNSTVTDVEDYAFKNSAIKYFELPDSLISIGTNAFH